MAPKWFRLIVAWLARRRSRTQQTPHPYGPRRRASFPSYQTIPSSQRRYHQQQHSRSSSGAPLHFVPVHSRNPSSGSIAQLPPGYVYRAAPGAPYYTSTANASPFQTQHVQQSSDPYRRPHAYVPVTPGAVPPQQYYFAVPPAPTPLPQMTQVPAAKPVTVPRSHREKSLPRIPPPSPLSVPGGGSPVGMPTPTSRPRQLFPSQLPPPPRQVSPSQPRQPSPSFRPPPPQTRPVPPTHPAPPTRPAPPPPPVRRSARIRGNSTPIPSSPYHAPPKRVHAAHARYTAFWSGTRSPKSVTFENVPWPMVNPPKHPTSITVHAVRAFLLSPHHSQDVPARQRVESAKALWDPATSFWPRFGPSVKPGEKEKIERALSFLQGTLRILLNEVDAAEQAGADVIGSP